MTASNLFAQIAGAPSATVDPHVLCLQEIGRDGRGVAIVLSMARRLRIVGRIGIVLEHLRDDGTSDQRFQLSL
jgi:hypothetical protein